MKLQNLFEQEEKTIASIPWVTKILDSNGNMPEFETGSLIISGWKVTTLRGVPKKIDKNFDAASNELTDLEGFPSYVGEKLFFNRNKIPSLKNIHNIVKHAKMIICDSNPLESNVLGLLKIEGLNEVKLYDKGGHVFGISYPKINEKLKIVETIINKYLPKGDIMDCQDELIDAGLEEFAKL